MDKVLGIGIPMLAWRQVHAGLGAAPSPVRFSAAKWSGKRHPFAQGVQVLATQAWTALWHGGGCNRTCTNAFMCCVLCASSSTSASISCALSRWCT